MEEKDITGQEFEEGKNEKKKENKTKQNKNLAIKLRR